MMTQNLDSTISNLIVHELGVVCPYLEGRLPRNNRFEIDSVHFDLKTMRLIACYHRTGADTSETLYKGLFAEGYLLLREGYVQDQMIPLEYEQAARWMDLRGLDEKKWL